MIVASATHRTETNAKKRNHIAALTGVVLILACLFSSRPASAYSFSRDSTYINALQCTEYIDSVILTDPDLPAWTTEYVLSYGVVNILFSYDKITWTSSLFTVSPVTGINVKVYFKVLAPSATAPSYSGEFFIGEPGRMTAHHYVYANNGVAAVSASNDGPATCVGDIVHFSTNLANGTYTWGGPGSYSATGPAPSRSSLSLPMAGIYTLTATGYPGCTVTTTTNLIVNTTPNAGTITGPSAVIVGTAITLANSIPGGVWSCSNSNAVVSSSGVVTGMLVGSVTVSYTKALACGTAVATKIIYVNATACPSWIPVGTSFAPTSFAPLSPHVMATNTAGIPYVAFADNDRAGKLTVKRYNAGVWENVGVTGFTDTNVYHIFSLAFDRSGTPYIAFRDEARAGRGTVMKYNGTAWVLVGGAGFTSDNIYGMSMAIDSSGTIFLASMASSFSLSVVKYNGSGWVTVGAASLPTGLIVSPSITISNTNVPYILYRDLEMSVTAKIIKYEGSAWIAVGTSDVTELGINYSDIAISPTGIPYIVYQGSDPENRMTVRKFTADGWETVGSIAITSTYESYCKIKINSSGTPYICFRSGLTGNITMLTYNGTEWEQAGESAFATNDIWHTEMHMALGNDGLPFISCRNDSNKIIVNKLEKNILPITGSTNICTGSVSALTNATPGGGIWSSSNTAIATVNVATGIVTGITPGTAVISYTKSSCTASVIVTVASGTAGAITGTSTVCTGSTTTLAGTESGGTWSSGNTAIATINGTSGLVTGVAAGTVYISYSISSSCGTSAATTIVTINPLPDAGTITGVANICPGYSATLATTITGGIWSSSSTSVATVGSADGGLTGIAAGTTVISYTKAGTCGSSSATFIVSVDTTPSAGSITGAASVCESATTTLYNTITGGTWSSSNTSIATVGSSGFVTGLAAGTAIISYAVTNGCGTDVAVTTITVNPSADAGSITGPSTVAIATTAAFSTTATGGTWSSSSSSNAPVSGSGVVSGAALGTATISYRVTNDCGTDVATKNITIIPYTLSTITGTLSACTGNTTALSNSTTGGTWASASGAVATVGIGTGIVTGIAPGTATIVYTLMGYTTSAVVTVNALPASITGSGVCLSGTTTLLSATSGGTWSSSNTAKITIDASSGIATGIATGTATITYTIGEGCYRTASVTVKPLPSAIAGTTAICTGTTTVLTNPTPSGMSWTSSNPAVATIGASSGVLTGLSAGTTLITFTLTTGCSTTSVVTVSAVPATVTGATTVCAGATTPLSSTDAGGTWSSSAATVATVGTSGMVTGIAAGGAYITYTLPSGCRTIRTITVSALPASITGAATICEGSTTAFSSTTSGGTWASSNSTIAAITSSGAVTGISAGAAAISYTGPNGCARTMNVTVAGGIPAITGTSATCAGLTTPLAIATTGGGWSSSNPSIATVSSTGIVTGIATGTANIAYTLTAGCRSEVPVTVSAALPAISGPVSVCLGAVVTLTNATTSGTWISSNAAIASVNATTGEVTGAATGTAAITYTSSAGCMRSASMTVKALPAAIVGNTSLCIGSNSVVTDPTPGVSWASSAPLVATIGASSGLLTGIASGIATITYLATTGCIATAVVSVDTAPSAGTITGPSSVSVGNTITLSNATPGGTWSSNNTTRATVDASGIVTGISAPGAATISYTVTNGVCRVAATRALTSTAGRDATSAAGNELTALSVYPNPTTGSFTVKTAVAGTFTIFTIDGRQLQQTNVQEGINTISISHELANGIYMCRYAGNDGSTAMVRLVYER